jgi:hypothetical protein
VAVLLGERGLGGPIGDLGDAAAALAQREGRARARRRESSRGRWAGIW